ncbi:MAG: DAK2 domain-containing protein [Bacteroidales bacterium]|nr:DAK2 domain-containing protein [Bacteroidales bacterium]
MGTLSIRGCDYLWLVKAGSSRLNANRKEINDLNVFPIPDGDTGDNMYMTIRSGCDYAEETESLGIDEVASSVSHGMLLGARGNSGVILSRIFAGIAKGLAGAREADLEIWKNAMLESVSEAYSSVATPVEGTILTVLKDAVRYACSASNTSFEEFFADLCDETERSLDRTPDLLPVLKDAGVVDSGGAGLLYILTGMRDALSGYKGEDEQNETKSVQNGKVDLSAFTEDSILEFGYCTEFLLRLQTSKVGSVPDFDESVIRDYLQSAGESLVFFRDASIIKAHIHTRTPGNILNACQKWGEYLSVKIENMTLQHHENHMEKKIVNGPRKRYAVVAVASGKGIVDIFKDNGVDYVIEGGQTMNPSAESFIEAFDSVNADVIYVLPDNSNIILTARQSAELYDGSDVRVICTKSIGSGYAVLGSVDFSGPVPDTVVSEAEAIAADTVAGMVSTATRNTKDAVKGDYIGFSDGDVLCDSSDRSEALISLCAALKAGDYDVLIVFKGAGVPDAEADALAARLQGIYSNAEVVFCDGGQPVYDYLLILE